MIKFGLFILVNAVLILRPTDLVPELEQAPIYECAILLALAAAARPVMGQLVPALLVTRPVSLFVIGILIAVLASHLAQFKTAEAQNSGFMFLKIVLYYLLLVANIRTVSRFRLFVRCIIGLMFIQVCLSLFQYYGLIDVDALKSFRERELDQATGEYRELPRIRGAGIFNDPNEYCVLLAIGLLFTLYSLWERQGGFIRIVWIAPLIVFAWAIPLTYSRGGMIALLAGLFVLAAGRYGLRRGIIFLMLIIPVVAVALGGRQTRLSLDDPTDTSQHRLRLWSDGLMMFRESPLFGIGQGRFPELSGLGAHNSFIEAYAELGLLGGTCLAATVVYPLWALWRVRRRLRRNQHSSLRHLHPFIAAVLVTQATGMISLSRIYTQPTYLVIGLSTVYLQLTATALPGIVPRLTQSRALQLALVGIGFLLVLQLFTSILIRWS